MVPLIQSRVMGYLQLLLSLLSRTPGEQSPRCTVELDAVNDLDLPRELHHQQDTRVTFRVCSPLISEGEKYGFPIVNRSKALQIAFGATGTLAGIDKFFNLLADWSTHLSPIVLNTFPVTADVLMRAVG